MAKPYKKGRMIYITWWDPNLNKSINRSTGLLYSAENLKLAKVKAREIQESINREREKRDTLGIRKTTLADAFQQFLKNNKDKNPKTIREYELFFQRLQSKFNKNEPCTAINKISAESWLNDIKDLALSRNTKYCINKDLKKFLNFLFEYNYIPLFKINKDVTIRQEVKEIITFEEEDIEKIFLGLDKKNLNFKTTIFLLFYTGLRPSDIYNIQVRDIDLKNKMMKYYSLKTDEHFMVPIHKELLPVLGEAIEMKQSGKILEYENINNIGKAVRRYFESIGIDKKGYNLRTFRKTFISLAYASGIDLAVVSKLVGHKNILTTAKHYNKVAMQRQSVQLNKLRLKNKKRKRGKNANQ